MDLLTQIRDFIHRHSLLAPGDVVVVGVSGGPDSLCLLHLLRELQATYRLQLYVAHLHHGVRGKEADDDAAFVAALAQQWQLPVTVERQDVLAVAREQQLAFEEAARRVRYAFLGRVAGQVGATRIAVGHNADDQAETVLMHWLRGAGLAGLRGMLPATALSSYRLFQPPADSDAGPLTLIRPLLATPRADVEQYCAAHGLQPRFDRSNLDTTLFRNRLRHELLPLLETYNPNVRQRLCHTAAIVAADYDLLERLRDAAWRETVRQESEQAVIFDRAAWLAQPLSIQRALIRAAAYRLRPQLRDVGFIHVENGRRVAEEGTTGAQSTLPDGLMLQVGYDSIVVAGEGRVPSFTGPVLPPGKELLVALPGQLALPNQPWALEASLPRRWSLAEIEANRDRWTAWLDADRLAAPLLLRSRRRGERFRPQGMAGHAPKLSDWMTNAKIPRAWRDRLPLLVAGGEIAWVCGWRVSEMAVVGPETRRAARFRLRMAGREGNP
ncbi:MAG: tRNA lysidine(34) synthetase TilS [Anaerolineae bacterium]|nr:tRNA lysidine(34) synthetase TilS [Anaerolineae bacterium]